MREEITKTETIFDGRVVHLRLHTVTLPDGNEAKREVVLHPGAVAIAATDAEHNVLLVQQFRLPVDEITYEVPAGTLEPDEDPAVCAVREMREETGYKPNKLEPLGKFYTAPGYTSEVIHLYHAIGYEPAPLEQDADEFVEVQRIPLREALAMIERGAIPDGKSMAVLLRVARKLGI